MKIQWKELIICVLLPLAVGALSAFLTKDSMMTFSMINKPLLAPPGWLFPVVWTILYILMGLASYLVLTSPRKYGKRLALAVYGLQLFFNFFWSIIFFNQQMYLFAFIWLILLWILILITMVLFWRKSPGAALLLVPYLLWVTFAGYLNLGIYLLN